MLLFAAVVSYLSIGAAVLGVEAISQPEMVGKLKYRVLQFGVFVATAAGGRAVLERSGAERLLTWTLVILSAGCAIVLASPWLYDMGVLLEYRHPYRITGTFFNPNEAGFAACLTAALALAFQSNGRQRPLGYLALVLGCAAGLASFSFTAILVLGGMLILFLLLTVRRLRQDLLHTGLTVLCMVGVLVWLIPGAPVVNTHQAWIDDPYETKRVGDTITVSLVDNKPSGADDYPANSWRWQRADARPGDVDTPDDATWTNIEDALLPNYTPADEDGGKFLRAWASYEKNGRTHRAQTEVIGPIMAASAATATDANAPLPLNGGWRKLSRRMLLWRMGFNKVLESPIAGRGLFQFHHMEGAPIGQDGKPAGVHNMYMMLSGEAGVIPLALYLLALFFLMRLFWTVPKSLGRDMVVGWVVVIALYGLPYHYLLTTVSANFIFGLACTTAAFLVQRQRDPTAA